MTETRIEDAIFQEAEQKTANGTIIIMQQRFMRPGGMMPMGGARPGGMRPMPPFGGMPFGGMQQQQMMGQQQQQQMMG